MPYVEFEIPYAYSSDQLAIESSQRVGNSLPERYFGEIIGSIVPVTTTIIHEENDCGIYTITKVEVTPEELVLCRIARTPGWLQCEGLMAQMRYEE